MAILATVQLEQSQDVAGIIQPEPALSQEFPGTGAKSDTKLGSTSLGFHRAWYRCSFSMSTKHNVKNPTPRTALSGEHAFFSAEGFSSTPALLALLT